MSSESPASHRRPGRKAYLLIALFALLLVLFPFLFWYNTWFGRKLSDGDIDRYFTDRTKPRRAQHSALGTRPRSADSGAPGRRPPRGFA